MPSKPQDAIMTKTAVPGVGQGLEGVGSVPQGSPPGAVDLLPPQMWAQQDGPAGAQ